MTAPTTATIARRAAGAAAGLLGSWLPVRGATVGSVEAAVFQWINGLPEVPHVLPWLTMQVGNVGATVVAAVLALRYRSRELAVRLAAGGLVSWIAAKVLKASVDRGRPAAILDDVELRHATTSGLGWVSGHAAVTAALLTIAWPALAPRWRWAVLTLATPMYVTRIYVGEHLPLDMAGGALLGLTCGLVVELVDRLRRSAAVDRAVAGAPRPAR